MSPARSWRSASHAAGLHDWFPQKWEPGPPERQDKVTVAHQPRAGCIRLVHPLPIITTINIRHDYRLQQNRRTFTNFKKVDWTQFTEDAESAFAQTTIPTNIHTANIILTNIILMADRHNIPNGKMHSNCRLLLDHIVCKITQRNNMRRVNTCDPALKLLNEEKLLTFTNTNKSYGRSI